METQPRAPGPPSEHHSFNVRSLRRPVKTTDAPRQKNSKIRCISTNAPPAHGAASARQQTQVQVMITIDETKRRLASEARNWHSGLKSDTAQGLEKCRYC